jgi:hypothetical protein
MLDDTCYFLPCSSAPEAAALYSLCNDPAALSLLNSASFADAKRPITKALLQRLDLRAILERGDREVLLDRAAAACDEETSIGTITSLRDEVDRVFSSLGPTATDLAPEAVGRNPPVLLT